MKFLACSSGVGGYADQAIVEEVVLFETSVPGYLDVCGFNVTSLKQLCAPRLPANAAAAQKVKRTAKRSKNRITSIGCRDMLEVKQEKRPMRTAIQPQTTVNIV